MHNVHKPDSSEVLTSAKLLRSTGVAALVAGALLVTVVLPAEYAVDPTGVGQVIGLTEMGRVKRSLAAEAEQEAAADAADPATPQALQAPANAPSAAQPQAAAAAGATTSAAAPRTDVTTLTLAPDQGAEIKLAMREGASARYVWETDGGRVNFDVHGDWPGTSYHGYGKGSDARVEDVLTAAADGSHGWFWRNRTDAPVTITLRTSGDYAEIKRVV